MTNVPFYDFPQSPILLIGFGGILTALAVLYVANRKYFNSPLNDCLLYTSDAADD